jgi:hypothetical protein
VPISSPCAGPSPRRRRSSAGAAPKRRCAKGAARAALIGFGPCRSRDDAPPIPFGTLPPAWALILLALAMLQRDGVVLRAALGLGVAALAWNATVVWALLAAGEAVLHLPQGWMPEWLAAPIG